MKRNCKYCKKSFEINSSSQKYCEKCKNMSYKERNHKYYLKTKNKYKMARKLSAKKNSNTLDYKLYRKNYRQEHKLELAKYMRKYRDNPIHKLVSNLRTRIWFAIKGYCKSAKTIELIGCSIQQLKFHLQNQFKKGMSWSNYGKWHIDHVISCCKFNLSKPKEQKRCFNFKNLQPLWAEENWSKGK